MTPATPSTPPGASVAPTAPALQDGPVVHPALDGSQAAAWWRSAVIYQVYPRSWADSTGDGVGDLPGITGRLDHLVELGVDALWLSPFYRSPQHDAGYDVADYRDVDPRFGRLADADALLARARELGLRVIVDLVPNHTSSEHPWFGAALAAAPGSPERGRYLFRPGKGQGDEPPNDWRSVFGGRAWTRVPDPDGRPGEWYLHLFDVTQPDLDWTNAEVHAEFEAVLRFWLDRGVDGFRVDVAHGLVKEAGLPDWSAEHEMLRPGDDGYHGRRRAPMWDQDGVHDIYRDWRRVLDAYNPPADDGDNGDDGRVPDPARDRILCAEAWVDPLERAARYVRPDEMHQAFNFEYLQAAWRADAQRNVIAESYRACDAVRAPTTWVLSNHDVVRHATRLALPTATHSGRGPNGVGPRDPEPDAALGLRRARAATTVMLALPGSAYLYQGEELGLPEHTSLPDDVRQDPTWLRTDRAEYGRDGCRVPMPWEADAPAYGFNSTGATWLPQPEAYGALAVDRQRGVPGSTYELYRALLRLRRERGLGAGELRFLEGYGADVVAFAVAAPGREGVVVVANLGPEAVALPELTVLVGSDERLSVGGAGGVLEPDTAAWLAR